MGVGGVAAYNTFFNKTKASVPSESVNDIKYEAIKRDTIYDFSSGEMKITRNRVEDKSSELDDSWTVLMYVCGSDLESDKGVDSKTLDSFQGSNINAENISNLNLIVQTGGTDKWKSNYGTPDKLTRLKLNSSGTLEEIEKIDNKSMGDPHTLADFMKWGYTKYPAKNTMLILVDHGGPENNMCYDTSTGKVDELTIQELEYAFAKTKESLQAPIDTVYNTVYAKLGEETICLGENADAVYNEETGEFKSNFKGEWLILSDGQLLTTYYTGKLKDYDNGGNDEGDVYAIPVQIGDKESTIYITKGDTEVKVEYVTYDAYGQTMSGHREELTAGMKFIPIYDVWNEEENTYDTEYGEEYTYKGENDFLYTILSEDEYSYAFIVEDASGHKMVSEMQKFSVIGQEVMLKTEEKENIQ